MANVVVTGASGFVGQNLVQALRTRTAHEVIALSRDSALDALQGTKADHIVHLAGANRPATKTGFTADNVDYAERILICFRPRGPGSTFHYASTTRVTHEDPYGRSKKAGKERGSQLAPAAGWSTAIWHLSNRFGKWCQPNYNSFVATVIDQASRGEPLSINDPASPVDLLYIDDLVEMLLARIESGIPPRVSLVKSFPTTRTTVGEVAGLIESFRRAIDKPQMPAVGAGLSRPLHATDLSHLDQNGRVFGLQRFTSETGSFCELFKAQDFGQVSVLTIKPGASRSNHYHHAKGRKLPPSARSGRIDRARHPWWRDAGADNHCR